jgi:polyhydroxyalkanoate synthase subunit PhaC
MEEDGTDWREVERARFGAMVLKSAMSPTNTLPGNPTAIKRAFESGSLSLVKGARNLVSDLVHNGGMPAQVARSAYRVGRDMALTPGAVVHRMPYAEVIQYRPATPTVRARPVVIVPPPIGRFYFLDLRPGRSFIEYAVSRGLQVFLVSWRNPQPEHADWSLDDYSRSIVEAVDAVRDITGSEDVNLLGFCAGGILQSGVLNHEAATGGTRVHSASYAVTLLDFDERAPIGAFSSRWLLELAAWRSRQKGVITARSMGSVFTLMRPDELVFNYLVSGWLLGEDPPAFDILAWNADGTNLPARPHAEFLDIFANNTMIRPGELVVMGEPYDLGRVTVPTFVTGAVSDHLTPWTGCYRTTQILSGPSTFVLSNAGHVASLVNPPGNPKASYYIGGPDTADPNEWLAGATKRTGSWWEAWADWVLVLK